MLKELLLLLILGTLILTGCPQSSGIHGGGKYTLNSIGADVEAELKSVPLMGSVDGVVTNPAKLKEKGLKDIQAGDRITLTNMDYTGVWKVRDIKRNKEITTGLGFDQPELESPRK